MSETPIARQKARANVDGQGAVIAERLLLRHLAFGWWCLACFLALGLLLEALHGLKIDWYLGRAFETRRLVWRLAHVHGTLLAVVNLLFAFSIARLCHPTRERSLKLASRCLQSAALLMPLGFFVGGVSIQGGDPNVAIVLVPVGALLALLAVLLIAEAALVACGSRAADPSRSN